MRDRLNITAHSGCDGTAEDSLESVEEGIRLGADAVEVDVRIAGGGTPVLAHDRNADGYGGRPSLEEALELLAAGGSAGINCDVKEPEAVPFILELAARKSIGPDRLILTGAVSPGLIRENPRILQGASVWMNVEEIIRYYYDAGHESLDPYRALFGEGLGGDAVFRALARCFPALLGAMMAGCRTWGVRVLNMPHRLFTASLASLLKAEGGAASVWTVNGREDLGRYMGLGPLNITTRTAGQAAEVREETLSGGSPSVRA